MRYGWYPVEIEGIRRSLHLERKGKILQLDYSDLWFRQKMCELGIKEVFGDDDRFKVRYLERRG